jgi:hypothetical protein
MVFVFVEDNIENSISKDQNMVFGRLEKVLEICYMALETLEENRVVLVDKDQNKVSVALEENMVVLLN